MTTSYTSVFGNLTVPPSEYQYQALSLTGNAQFYWPSQYSGTGYILAKINSIAATTGAYTLTLPQASVVSTGMDTLFINSTGSTITIKDYSGGAVTTISAGVAKYIYVADNSTDAGVWGVVTYGNTTALVDASALAGYGTKATGSTLSVDSPVTETALTITVNATSGRGQSYVFTGGSVPCTFPSALSAGSGFFFYVKNGGTGTVTLTPVGGDTVDLQSTLGLNPDESCLVISTGVDWHTIGLGRSTIYQFTKLVKDLTGISSYTLTSSDASNKLLQFTGAPSAATTITVPAVVSIYYVQISTSNAYTVTLKTAAGTGVALAQNANAILYCDGVNVVAAQTASVPASQTVITNDTTTNATMYPAWVTAGAGNLPLYVSTSKFSFNPSTGALILSGTSTASSLISLAGVTSGAAGGASGSLTLNGSTSGAASFSSNTTGNLVTLDKSLGISGNLEVSTSATVTAGTNAQGQGALTADLNVITTASSNPSGVTLPTAVIGMTVIVINKGANTVNVYPASGATIDALGVNVAIPLTVGSQIQFRASSTTQWYSFSVGVSGLPIAAAGGTVDAITADFTPDLTLTDKVTCMVVCGGANTSTTPTFAPDGLTAHTITMNGGQALVAGSIPAAGFVAILEYNSSGTRWELLNPKPQSVTGLGGTTITGNVTLTSASAGAMVITPTGPGLYMTLPDATTCTKGGILFSGYNAGDYDYGVKNNAGTQLGWIRPRTGAVIGLADSSTSAGVWAPYGLQKVGTTLVFCAPTGAANFTTGGGVNRSVHIISIDTTRYLVLYGATNAYAFVVDTTTGTMGAVATIRSSIGTGAKIGVLCATDKVLVVTCDSATAMEAVTLSISGTTITVNTANKATATLSGNWASFGQLVAVGSSWVLSYGRATTVSAIVAITVSTNTPTIGSESTLSPGVSTPAVLFVSGSVVRTVNASSSFLYAKPFTVSGSTLSAGTEASTATTAAAFRAVLNGNGNIVCNYLNTSHYAAIFKLTTTTEAVSAVTIGTAPNDAQATADYINIGSNKTVFVSYPTGGVANINILTDTAGTASAGTQQTNTTTGNLTCVAGLFSSSNTAYFLTASATTSGVVCLLGIDASGATASITSNRYFRDNSTSMYSGIDNFASNLRGERKVLQAGSSAYVITKAGPGNWFFAPNAFTRLDQTVVPSVGGTNYESGLTAGDMILSGSQDNSATGMNIVRVEAAA